MKTIHARVTEIIHERHDRENEAAFYKAESVRTFRLGHCHFCGEPRQPRSRTRSPYCLICEDAAEYKSPQWLTRRVWTEARCAFWAGTPFEKFWGSLRDEAKVALIEDLRIRLMILPTRTERWVSASLKARARR